MCYICRSPSVSILREGIDGLHPEHAPVSSTSTQEADTNGWRKPPYEWVVHEAEGQLGWPRVPWETHRGKLADGA